MQINFREVFEFLEDSPVLAQLLQGQRNLFAARRNSLDREAALLRKRKAQFKAQIVGAEAQVNALETRLDLLAEELLNEIALFGKGLSPVNTGRALQREVARIRGLVAELLATIAQRRGRIAEIEIEILRLETRLREDAITTLRNLQYKEIEVRESRKSLMERLQRMNVRAPVSGVFYNKQFHALSAVVRPADTILTIVPQDTAFDCRPTNTGYSH